MILDALDRFDAYAPVLPGLEVAIAFARSLSPDAPAGRHEIDGDSLYANLDAYTTEPAESRRFEAHRRYADLQVVLDGAERMDVAETSALTVAEEYDPDRDCAFFDAPARFTTLLVPAGSAVLFLPHDAHRPCCQLAAPADIRKVVVKIRLA